MRPKFRSIILAALGGAALTVPGLAYQAQPETNGSVGPSEIRDFSLPGTPPAPQPDATPTPAPPPPPAAEEPAPEPADEAPASTEPRDVVPDAAAPADVDRPAEDGPRPGRPASPNDDQKTVAETPPEGGEQPAPATPEAPAAPTTEEVEAAQPVAVAPPEGANGAPGWLWAALGGLAVLGGAAAALRLRRRRDDEPYEPEPVYAAEPDAVAQPEPELELAASDEAPVPDAVPEPVVAAATAAPVPAGDVPGIVMRPWLELHFKPARATATEGGASVQYEAVIRNVGNAPARNVRLAARMFNSGQDVQAEVTHFYSMGIDAPDGAPLTILPRTEVSLSSVVTMAREDMREVKVQGRSLFIPTVAFNLLYDWGRDKIGQTCSAHVVGREPDPPAEKMAPFRLDLGPRVYRSVGQRPSALARTT